MKSSTFLEKYLTNCHKNAASRTFIKKYIFRLEAISLLPVNPGGYTAYQNFLVTQLTEYYLDFDALYCDTWEIMEHFYLKDLSQVDIMMRDRYFVFDLRSYLPSSMLLSLEFKVLSYTEWVRQLKLNLLYTIRSGLEVGDKTPVVISAKERKRRICACREKSIFDCTCNRFYSQQDCDIGWDSSRDCFFHGYDLYLLTASEPEFLTNLHVEKLLLDAAHDAMPIYEYCRKEHITPFIDLNDKGGIKLKNKDDFTVGRDDITVCRTGLKMPHNGVERKKHRFKFRCPWRTAYMDAPMTTPALMQSMEER